MTGFELRTSGVGSDRSTNWATTAAHPVFICWVVLCRIVTLLRGGVSPPDEMDEIKWSRLIIFREKAILNENHNERGRIIIEARHQCDQIWRNFAQGANFQNLKQTLEGIFSVWLNFEPTLAKLLWILGRFELLYVVK